MSPAESRRRAYIDSTTGQTTADNREAEERDWNLEAAAHMRAPVVYRSQRQTLARFVPANQLAIWTIQFRRGGSKKILDDMKIVCRSNRDRFARNKPRPRHAGH